jgi:hypothetical protein
MYAISSLVAPMIPRLPLRRTITACFLVYILYIASLNSGILAVYLVCCPFVGIAAGTVWYTQGKYMMRLAAWDGETGKINAIFYGLFYSQNIVGYGIGLGVLFSGLDLFLLLWIMCGISFIGVVLSFFIRPVKRLDSLPKVYHSVQVRFRLLWFTLREHCVIFLIPSIALQSIGIVLSYQVMTRSIILFSLPQEADTNIAFSFLGYGFGNIIGAFGGGRLFDLSWRWVFWPVCGIEITSGVLMILFNEVKNIGPVLLWIIVGFLRGLSDSALNALVCSVITNLRFKNYIGGRPDGLVFGLYRGIYCLCFIPVSVISGYVSYLVIVILDLVFVGLSIVFYGFLFQRLELPEPPIIPSTSQVIPEPKSISTDDESIYVDL